MCHVLDRCLDVEDNDHLIIDCGFTRELWGRLYMIRGDHWVAPRKIGNFLFFNHRGFGNK